MLKFESQWRYSSPGPIPSPVVEEFSTIISKIARGKQDVLEHFKTYFAGASGTTTSWSSSASWAATDLDNFMGQASDNAPLFIEAFYDACVDFNKGADSDVAPDYQFINGILSKHGANYQIDPPNLLASSETIAAIPLETTTTLDDNARNLIQESISECHRLLADGKHKQAVQEILWLLETITTVFSGVTAENNVSIQGKYFNKILDALKQNSKGSALEQIIIWIKNLHGFLSAPAGGGIRHGMDLKEGVATTPAEAKLYCNLIISYISFLISEYERLKNRGTTSQNDY
jgi:hypothetical protein